MGNFSFDTIENFDDHIDRSIPNYDILSSMVRSVGGYFFVSGENIYDLGCSTGKLLKSIDTDCPKIGYDIASLLPQDDGFYPVDLNGDFEIKNACLVYSIFTMQFLKPSRRLNYLKTIYDGLNDGGALIISEKVYRSSGKIQEIMSFSYYDYKLKSFSPEEILSKEADLRYIMKPMNDNDLTRLIIDAGFKDVDILWQSFNFKCLIAIK